MFMHADHCRETARRVHQRLRSRRIAGRAAISAQGRPARAREERAATAAAAAEFERPRGARGDGRGEQERRRVAFRAALLGKNAPSQKRPAPEADAAKDDRTATRAKRAQGDAVANDVADGAKKPTGRRR